MRAARRFCGAVVLTLGLGAVPAGTARASAQPPTAVTAPAAHHTDGAQRAGEIIGFIGLVGILVAWSEGYGLLGGRRRPRAPVQEPAGAARPDA